MPTAIDLFAGAGGADLGLRRAGWDVVRAIEWDAKAAATLGASGAHAVVGDVRDPALYDGIRSIDLLWGSPPCQAWSSAGQRLGVLDSRNGWPWVVDIIDRLRSEGRGPAMACFENVPAMLSHTSACTGDPSGANCAACYFHGWIVPQLLDRFQRVDYRVIDCADYGTPQRRKRLFVVCSQTRFRWPYQSHGSPNDPMWLFGSRDVWVSAERALGFEADRLYTTLGFDSKRKIPVGDRPSPTITTQVGKGNPWQSAGVPFVIGPSGPRRLSIVEAATLQTFPADYPWQGSLQAIYRQIGNAVPPVIAKALGAALLATLEEQEAEQHQLVAVGGKACP